MKPTIPRSAWPVLSLLAGVQVIKVLALVAFAEGVVAAVLAGARGADIRGWLLLAAIAVCVRAVTEWAVKACSEWAVIGEKERLRAALVQRWLRSGGAKAEAPVLATRGLDALDNYYTQFLPALVGAAVVPLLIWLWVLRTDWLSALIVALTVPLIPVFMALIGWFTQEKVALALDVLLALSHHVAELAKGLPVLVGLRRAAEQQQALADIDERYHRETMNTLKIAFLSALALELISTLSVALVAVTLGVRLISGGMDLSSGLVILMIVGECYVPLRDVGTAFHASGEGQEAQQRVAQEIASDDAAEQLEQESSLGAGEVAAVSGLRVQYAGRTTPALSALTVRIPATGLTAVTGPSGCGKTTLLATLTGTLPEGTEVSGRMSVTGDVAWVPQQLTSTEDTVAAELALWAEEEDAEHREQAAREALREAGLPPTTNMLERHPGLLSPGELRRLALARGILRLAAGAQVLLVDEPSAHVDEKSRELIQKSLISVSQRVAVVMVTHDAVLAAAADQRIALPAAPVPLNRRDAQGELDDLGDLAHTASSGLEPGDDSRAAEESLPAGDTPPASRGKNAAQLWLWILQPFRPVVLAAVLFAVVATLAAMALSALSGWLIVQASTHPPIMYLLTAIVGVRFFGLARALSRYLERLSTHSAVLSATARLRQLLWRGLSREILRNRSLQRGDTSLRLVVNDVDTLRDAAARLLTPLFGAAAATVGIIVTTWLWIPALLPAAALASVLASVGGFGLAWFSERRALRAQLGHHRRYAARLSAILPSAAVLRANSLSGIAADELAGIDAAAARAQRRIALTSGLGVAWVFLASGIGVVAMAAVSHAGLGSGSLQLGAVVGVALLLLALPDALAPALVAASSLPVAAVLARSLKPTLAAPKPAPAPAAPQSSAALVLDGVQAGWASKAVTAELNATVRHGQWLRISGPSGSGKSTVVATIMGFIEPVKGALRVQETAWCPQEAFLFDSTLRGNLALARPRGEAPSEAELQRVLALVGLGDWLAALPEGTATRVGSGGLALSGGQRQQLSVARALLASAQVYLLDEPTAHLDDDGAAALMADLRSALAGKAVVLISHREPDGHPEDLRLSLTGESAALVGLSAS